MKTLITYINESINNKMVILPDAVNEIYSRFGLSWLSLKQFPEIADFVKTQPFDILDVDATLKDSRTSLDIGRGVDMDSKTFCFCLQFTTKSGNITYRDWTDMDHDALRNATICVNAILNRLRKSVKTVPKNKLKIDSFKSDIEKIVYNAQTRSKNTIKVTERLLTSAEKKLGFEYIIDIEILSSTNKPIGRFSIGVVDGVIKYTKQDTVRNADLPLPNMFIEWEDITDKISMFVECFK